MPKNTVWKLVLILGTIALSVFLIYPPKEKINLGLDLQGGSHLLLQVETSAAVKGEIDLAINRIGQALKEKGITYGSVTNPAGTQDVVIAGVDPGRASEVREVISAHVPEWQSTTLEGNWTVHLPDAVARQIQATSVDTTLTVLRQRVDELGVKEPIIQKQGSAGDRIVVELPGLQ